jgi:hypothetical protein
LGLGLALAIAVAGVLDATVAGWLAVVFTVAGIAYDLVHPSVAGPAWLYLVDIALAAGCFGVARIGRVRRPDGAAIAWLAAVRYERPPAPASLPRFGRGWRVLAVALALGALGLTAWTWSAQSRMDAREQAANRVPAEVVRQVDDFTVRVRVGADRTVDVGVLDAQQYQPGQRIELYLDDAGLHQPATEPYDATGWLVLAALLAGVALAGLRRSADAGTGLAHLFGEAQPVTQVYARTGWGWLAVYPGDARPGEPAATELRVLVDPDTGDEGAEFTLPATHPALLYGIPAPGRWCTVAIDGVPMVPLRPLPATVNAPPFSDPSVAVDLDATLTPPALRPEQIEELSPTDRDSNPDQVRTHATRGLVGYPLIAAVPLSLIPLVKLLPGLSFPVSLAIAGIALAVSCLIGWRLYLRPRAAWNGGGIAVVAALGTARLRWPEVVGIEPDRNAVTLHTDEAGWVLPAVRVPGPFGGAERDAERLANALRLARERGLTDSYAEPPRLTVPAPPPGLYLLWFAWTPVLAWLLQVFSRY